MNRRQFLLTCALLMPILGHAGAGSTATLTDQDGHDFQLASLKGKVVMIVFGFTHCGMVCPIEMARLSSALRLLEDKSDRVQGVFITVDPERDDPATIKTYVNGYHSNIIGLTGTPEALDTVSRQYRVTREKQADGDIDHGTALFIIDQQGELQAAVPSGLPPAHIAEVVNKLLQ